jgi:hypothetical protein
MTKFEKYKNKRINDIKKFYSVPLLLNHQLSKYSLELLDNDGNSIKLLKDWCKWYEMETYLHER